MSANLFTKSKYISDNIYLCFYSAMDFRDELIHGFILVYSAKRRASLSTLTAFSLNIPELPIQLLAVSDEDFATPSVFSNEFTGQLITEGNTLADRLNAHFMTSTTTIQQKSKFFQKFWFDLRKKGNHEKEILKFRIFTIELCKVLNLFKIGRKFEIPFFLKRGVEKLVC